MSTLKSYNIALEIENSDRINSELRAISDNFKGIKNNIQSMKFDDSILENIDSMSKSIKKAGAEGRDVSKQIDAFGKASKALTAELSKQAEVLNFSLSAEGRAARERLAVLSKKKDLTKDEIAEQKKLSKIVVIGTDDEIKALLLKNKEIRINTKLKASELKVESNAGKQLQALQKKDTKLLDDKIKKQKEYNKTLDTTSKKMTLLQRVGGAAKKLGKGAALAGLGIVTGLLHGAAGAAQSAVDDENAVRRIKGGYTENERKSMLEAVKLQTGASSKDVVDAINRVSHLIKFYNASDTIAAAIQEIQHPGSAALFQASSKQGTKGKDWGTFAARLRGISQFTGSDLSDAISYARKSGLGHNRFSHDQAIALYSALQGSGAFQDQATMEKALEAFMRQADPSKDIFEQLKSYNFSRFVWKAQDKNAVRRGIASIDAVGLNNALKQGGGTQLARTDAENSVIKMRELENQKNKLYKKFIPILQKILEKAMHLLEDERVQKLLEELPELLLKLLTMLSNVSGIFSAGAGGWGAKATKKALELATDNSRSTPQTSVGGLTHGRQLTGERGQELVIPLNYERRGRSAQVVQNFTQNFTLTGTQSTALSLGQAVKGSSFSSAFLSARTV